MFRELEHPGLIVSNLTPNWFASIMGTGIVAVAAASLPLQFPGLRTGATVVWAIAALLLVAPSDHAVPDVAAFRRAVEAGMPLAQAGRIVTFGIKPTRAETGYGYLEVAGGPDRQTADLERFMPWRTTYGAEVAPKGAPEMSVGNDTYGITGIPTTVGRSEVVERAGL